jgi:hypothetical protein
LSIGTERHCLSQVCLLLHAAALPTELALPWGPGLPTLCLSPALLIGESTRRVVGSPWPQVPSECQQF